MKTRAWLTLVALLLAPVSLCWGQGPSPIPDGICSFDWSPHYEQLTRYTNLPVAKTGGTDNKTTLPRDETPTASELATLTETWYVARSSQGTATAAMNRLLSSANQDFLDSPLASEPGYSLNRSLDFPWTSAGAASRTPAGGASSGMSPLRRYLKSSPIDHITWLPGATPAGYVADATYDGLSNPERLGYPRFGNKLTKADVLGTATCTPGASTVYTGPAYGTHFLDNGVLRLDFNRVWGNALGRITQVSSCHQIVSEPIGDLVQTVVRFPDAVQPDGTAIDDPDCRNPNPTQSGGVWGNTSTEPTNYGKTEYWTGSPVLSTTKTTVGESQVLTSVVRPFEFVNNGVNQGDGSVPWSGAEPRSPLAWKGFIERTDVLGCKIGSVSPITRRDVVKTTSRLILAPNNGFSSYNVYSLNTYWLKATDLVVNTVPVVWDFKIECKNLRTGVIRPLLADAAGNVILNQGDASCGDDDNDPATAPDDHAILVTKKDGSFGYAVERLNLVVNEGTNVTFRCVANPCDTNDKGALIIQPARNQFSSRSSVNKTSWSIPLDTFLVVNNRNSMLIRLDELRTDGGDCLN